MGCLGEEKLQGQVILLLLPLFLAQESASQPALALERVVKGLDQPLFLTSPAGDFERLFILERPGRIRILKSGVLLEEPFLDLKKKITTRGEGGILGLAFHPDYHENGRFFINYTEKKDKGATIVAGFSVDPDDPDLADPDSRVELLRISQPWANHNGGMVEFGPDGFLYVGMGDGGAAGDPGNRAQDGSTFLGKLLRLDVDGEAPYGIPEDNPFLEEDDFLDEIWAYGLRNPWRFSFDRLTGDLWIGDVGQNAWEEIHFHPAGAPGGVHFGWRTWEGTHPFLGKSSTLEETSLPVHEYAQKGTPKRRSVTGGYVYRGASIPWLQGSYLFADWVSNEVWSGRLQDGKLIAIQDRTRELAPKPGKRLGGVVSFGEDAAGEVYILCMLSGKVWRIVDAEKAGP